MAKRLVSLAANVRAVPRFTISDSLALAIGACVLVYVSVFAFITRNYFMDDAYIGFTFVRNLLRGHGFVFYPGQAPVEGVTNVGWLALVSVVSTILPILLASKVLGFTLVLLTVLLLYFMSRLLVKDYLSRFPRALLLCAPLAMLLSSFDFLYFAFAGMETAFLAAILLSMASIAVARPYSRSLPMLGFVAFLVRPEAVLVYPIFVLIASSARDSKRSIVVQNMILFCLPILLTTAVRYLYFRALLPNTFNSKPTTPVFFVYSLLNTAMLQNTNFPFPISATLVFILPLMIIGARRALRFNYFAGAMLLGGLVTGMFFSIYALPDWTHLGRYFAPYAPTMIILLWIGVIDTLSKSIADNHRRWRVLAAAALSGAFVLASLGHMFAQLRPATLARYPGYVLASSTLVQPSLWIRDHVPGNAVIATRRIGAVAFYSERRVLDDKTGLTDATIAQLVKQRKSSFATPNDPALADVWHAVRPDYILEDEDTLSEIATKAGGSPQSFSIHGIAYHTVQSFPIGENMRWVLAGRAP